MGYACPVCSDPQADAAHLANHLAFTALARGGDHEAWLDERVPGWGELDEAGLADRVVEHAEERDYPQVFEDTADGAGSHDHGHDSGHEHRPATDHADGRRGADLPVETADIEKRLTGGENDDGDGSADEGVDPDAVLNEARELTRRRRENSETE